MHWVSIVSSSSRCNSTKFKLKLDAIRSNGWRMRTTASPRWRSSLTPRTFSCHSNDVRKNVSSLDNLAGVPLYVLVSNVQETVKKYAGDFDIFQVREGGRDDDVGCSLFLRTRRGTRSFSTFLPRRSQCLSPTERPPSALIFRILAMPNQERPKLICRCTLY